MNRYVLDECASTNDEAHDIKYGHGDAIIALSQTAGRGQRGNTWLSAKGENLTFTLVLNPSFLRPAEQFIISEVAALSVAATLEAYGIEARIKWPNDIYVGDRKICGILIEHDLHGDSIARTIAGVGLNVNQKTFPSSLPNPTSMSLESGRDYDIFEVFDTFYEKLFDCYNSNAERGWERTMNDYHSKLYRFGAPHRYLIPGEGEVTGTILRVEPSGRIIVDIEGKERGFVFKELEYII